MTKSFKLYSIIWTICLLVFNIVTFVSSAQMNIIRGNFWIGYIFILLTFLGQLYCSYIVLKEENFKKMFYNISLLLVSYISIFLIMVIGTVCMIFSVPMWISIVVCVVLTGSFAVITITTWFAINVVSNIDKEIKSKTFTIKKLSTDVEHLINIAQKEELRNICKKVYESLRYSDPVDNIVLSEINQQIQNEFKTFEDAINENDTEIAQVVSTELINLIDKRNKECTLLK